jgi:hypothetical protein
VWSCKELQVGAVAHDLPLTFVKDCQFFTEVFLRGALLLLPHGNVHESQSLLSAFPGHGKCKVFSIATTEISARDL